MRLYRLSFVIADPSEESGGKFVAEIPALPGCRAWGDTAAETIEALQSVATAFLESYQSHGDELPPEVEALATEASPTTVSEVLIAV
jgi:predicted RNase H-like HicB family nuclease